jgi:hypothetical protein
MDNASCYSTKNKAPTLPFTICEMAEYILRYAILGCNFFKAELPEIMNSANLSSNHV